MRLLTAAGLLLFSAGAAFGAYLVELDGGDRMTVDSYFEDGGRMHLMRGGVDLSVPKGRIRRMTPTDAEPDTAGVGRMPAEPVPPARDGAFDAGTGDRKDLEAAERRISHHLLRAQQLRFEAKMRGESPKTLRRYDREVERTQKRKLEAMRELGQ